MQQTFIHQNLLKRLIQIKNLADSKFDVDKVDIDKLRNLPTNKNKVDKLVPVPVDLSKLSDVVKNDVVKKRCI